MRTRHFHDARYAFFLLFALPIFDDDDAGDYARSA